MAEIKHPEPPSPMLTLRGAVALGLSCIGLSVVTLHLFGVQLLPLVPDVVSWHDHRLAPVRPFSFLFAGGFGAAVILMFWRPRVAGALLIAVAALCAIKWDVIGAAPWLVLAGGIALTPGSKAGTRPSSAPPG